MPDRRTVLTPYLLRALAEGGWITVVYAAVVTVFGHRPPAVGPVEFSLLVGLGLVLGHYSRRRFELGPVLLIAGALAGGAIGWLLSADARAVVLVNPAAALGIHASGWIGALAVLRGMTIQRGSVGAQQAEGLLRVTLPAVALVWGFGTLASTPPLWPAFASDALWGTLCFLVAAVMGLGLARLNILQAGFSDTRARRIWRLLVVVIAFAILPLALPIAVLSGIPIAQLLNPLSGPLNTIGWVLTLPLQFVVAVLEAIFKPLGPGVGELLDRLGTGFGAIRAPGDPVEPTLTGTILGILIALTTIAFILLLMYIVAQWFWGNRRDDSPRRLEMEGAVEHAIVVPRPEARASVGPERPVYRRRRPGNAVEAYLGALRELDRHPAYARALDETPAQHSSRLRTAGMPAARDLGRLAAAYQLIRYGSRHLSTSEDRRSIDRFHRLRRLLRADRRRP
jgi:hypothetical protein